MQANSVSSIFTAADTALQSLQPATAAATVAAAEALRKVLEALGQLSCHPSEAALKQLIELLRASAPELQQACWLLVSQQDDFRQQASLCPANLHWVLCDHLRVRTSSLLCSMCHSRTPSAKRQLPLLYMLQSANFISITFICRYCGILPYS